MFVFGCLVVGLLAYQLQSNKAFLEWNGTVARAFRAA